MKIDALPKGYHLTVAFGVLIGQRNDFKKPALVWNGLKWKEVKARKSQPKVTLAEAKEQVRRVKAAREKSR